MPKQAPLIHHDWPADAEHLYGPWMNHTSTPMIKTQYRTCVHPKCNHVEYRDVPKG